MYAQLLAAAWEDFLNDPEDDEATPGDLLAQLIELWPMVHPERDGKNDQDGDGHRPKGLGGVATELTYDVTLLRLASTVGIEPQPARFTHPVAERRRLERTLSAAGIDLDALESRANSESDRS